jgi:hypothetical protein
MRAALRPAERRSRFGFDYRLVCALLDRWRSETHIRVQKTAAGAVFETGKTGSVNR